MTIYFLWRIETCPIGSLCGIKCHLDPVISAIVALGFAICVGGEVSADHDVAAEKLSELSGGVGITARIIFTDHTL